MARWLPQAYGTADRCSDTHADVAADARPHSVPDSGSPWMLASRRAIISLVSIRMSIHSTQRHRHPIFRRCDRRWRSHSSPRRSQHPSRRSYAITTQGHNYLMPTLAVPLFAHTHADSRPVQSDWGLVLQSASPTACLAHANRHGRLLRIWPPRPRPFQSRATQSHRMAMRSVDMHVHTHVHTHSTLAACFERRPFDLLRVTGRFALRV